MNFRSVIAPVPPEEFASSIKEGRPLYIPGNADKFSGLFSKHDFWQCVAKGKRDGDELPRVSLTAYQLPLAFESGAISRALRSGNTVCTSHIDRASERLRQLCVDAESVLGFPGTACVHCYYSPPGTGYSFFHMDSGVAVTLQLEGAKLWKYAQEPALRWSTRVGGYRENERLEWFGESDWQPHDGTVPTPRDQDIAQRTLKPGDLLVMPPGVWHSVAASESTSISLNLKLTAAPAIDGILQVVRQACLHETRWRQPFPFASSDELDSGVASESAKCYVAEMVRDLGRTIAALADDEAALARLWFRNFLGSQDSIRAIASRAIQLSDVLAVPHGIHPRLSVASDGSAALLAQGKILHMRGTGVAEVVAAILRTRRFRASDVSTWPSARELASADVTRILQKLADAGFIALEMFEQS